MDKNNISLGTLYDFNKRAVLNEKPMSLSKIKKIMTKIENWFNWQLDGYAMLLCRERYDFTVFHLYEIGNKNPCAVATKELIDLLHNRGEIISIEKDSNTINNAWEIWLKIDNEAFAYYLFNCDEMVIQC